MTEPTPHTTQTKLTDRLPASVYSEVVHTLRRLLPEPTSKDPEDRTRQLETAIGKVGSFAPANAAEADLAARYVCFSAHADHCLRVSLLLESKGQLVWAVNSRAQANATARRANGQFDMLMRLQKERRKLEKDNQARDRAIWTEYCAIGMMEDALAEQTKSKPQPAAEPPVPSPVLPPAPQPLAQPQVPAPAEEPLLERDPDLSEAERYAVIYPARAALIRHAGGMRDHFDFDPPDDDLVQALLTAEGPIFTMLDQRVAQVLDNLPTPADAAAE